MSKGKRVLVLFAVSAVFFSIPFVGFAADIYTNSSTGNDLTGDGSIGSPYKTFTKAYTTASSGDTINLTGTFTWTDAAETGDAATTGYTLGKNLTIVGQGSDQTFIQAASASTSASARVFTISSGVVVSISKVNIRHGRLTSTSYYGGGISNSGTLNISDSEINNNTAGGGGGGIDNLGTTTAERISVYNNTVSYMGGGLLNNYNIATGGYFVVENSTIYGNYQNSTSGYLNGGGVHVRGGNMTLTNNSIIGNIAKGGGGLGMDTTGKVYLMNNLIVNNTSATYGSTYNDILRSSGTIVDNGYNIIGQPGGNSLVATGDWSDTNLDGIYNLYSVGTTGTLNLESGVSINDNATSTPTWALLSGSIAINNGGTGLNGGTSTVPTLDQRGAARLGATDIGSFEYGGTGLTISVPTTQASEITFSSVEYDTMTISWTKGSGSRRVVFMKAAASGSASPVDSTDYSANSSFGLGDQIGSSGWYAVYDGVGSSVDVTGLSQATTYIVQVFEYNGIVSSTEVYQTASASNNPNTQASHTITTIYADSSTGNDSTGDGSSGNPYKTFNKAYTSVYNGDTINLTGTFTWTDAAETGDAVTTGYTINKKGLTIKGQRADQTIIQVDTSSTTGDRRVFTVSSGVVATFTDLTIRHGRITSSSNYGGGIYSQGTTTVQRVLVTNNYVNGFGGGIAQQDSTNGGSLTVIDSTISYNTGVSQGGGIWNGTNTTGPVNITNSTVAYNTQTASSATVGGGGVAYRSGSGTITNSTIAYNNIQNGGTSNGAGLWIAQSAGYTVTLMNNIISSNYKSSTALTGGYYDIYKSGSGTYVDNGGNIIGDYSSASITIATSTYVDLQGSVGGGDGAFTNSNGGSGSLYLDTTLADNASTKYTQTLAITSASSIAVDNGYGGTNATILVPSTDQRAATRSGTVDVGAYEYGGGGLDEVVPTVSLTAPTDSASVSGSSISFTANASDNVGVAGVSFYVDGALQESEDTGAPYGITWNSTATSSGSKTVVAVARDTAGNYATSTTITITVANEPTPSSVSASTATTTATLTWTTSIEGSTRVFFGIVSDVSSSTPEANTVTRVTNHSVDLSSLPACTVFKYRTVSVNEGSDVATSSVSTFKTAGCTGSATISSNNESTITTASGGTLTQGNLTLVVPTSFASTSSSVMFQASKLDNTAFTLSAGVPSGRVRAGTDVFHLSSYVDESTKLSTFDVGLNVTFSYSTSDVASIDESSLKIYRYDGLNWIELSNCSVDTGSNTVTCTTTQFSDFAIFGDASVNSSSSVSGSGNGPIFSGSAKVFSSYVAPRPQIIYPNGTVVYLDEATSTKSSESNTGLIVEVKAHLFSLNEYVFERTLRAHSQGEDVRALQRFLNNSGFVIANVGLGSLGNESDYFGPLTYNALVKFQEAYSAEILAPLGLVRGTGIFAGATRAFVNKYNKEKIR